MVPQRGSAWWPIPVRSKGLLPRGEQPVAAEKRRAVSPPFPQLLQPPTPFSAQRAEKPPLEQPRRRRRSRGPRARAPSRALFLKFLKLPRGFWRKPPGPWAGPRVLEVLIDSRYIRRPQASVPLINSHIRRPLASVLLGSSLRRPLASVLLRFNYKEASGLRPTEMYI